MEFIVSGAISIGTMVVGYLLGKKKQDAETRVTQATAQTSELDAVEKAVAIWRGLAQDLRKETLDLKKEVEELSSLVLRLENENTKLRDEINHLQEKLAKIA